MLGCRRLAFASCISTLSSSCELCPWLLSASGMLSAECLLFASRLQHLGRVRRGSLHLRRSRPPIRDCTSLETSHCASRIARGANGHRRCTRFLVSATQGWSSSNSILLDTRGPRKTTASSSGVNPFAPEQGNWSGSSTAVASRGTWAGGCQSS
jgi:hypothetical protein